MRTPFPTRRLVVFVLVVAPVTNLSAADRADTRPVFDRLADLKPAPANPADSPLRKLQKERFNARLAAAQVQVKAVQAGAASSHDLSTLVVLLAENGADLEDKPADRVKWYQMRVDVLREQERLAQERSRAGAASSTVASLATATRADAEIELLKLTETLKGTK